MDIVQYLNRIQYHGPIRPDFTTLETLLLQHSFTVPFENIDIQTGKPIRLDHAHFFEKIVARRRGGYCYEINGLFYWLLSQFGFDTQLISGGVVNGKSAGREFDHLAILVLLNDKRWLVDAGYGDFSLKPLALQPGVVQSDGRNQYMIEESTFNGEKCLLASKWNSKKQQFQPEYYFTTSPRELVDFSVMNEYQQLSPQSHFTQNLICSLPSPQGRTSIINNKLVLTGPDGKNEIRFEMDELQGILDKYFNITLDCEELNFRFERSIA